GKNWRCNNLSDNLGIATLTAVRAIGAGNGGNQIGGLNTAEEFHNKAGAEIGRIGAGLEQLLYLFSTSYTTVEHLKQMAVFGQLMGVEEFSTRIKKSQTAQQNADLQSTIKSFQETMSRATKTLDNSKKSSKKRAEDTAINRFLSDLLRKNLGKHSADEYDHDPIEDISDSLAGLTLNSVIKTAETIRKVLQSELKLIFSDHFFQDPIKANILNQAPLIQEKIESPSNTSLITEV
ncbi:1211_t:CDS:2, partial [Dentiscutata heterogama]